MYMNVSLLTSPAFRCLNLSVISFVSVLFLVRLQKVVFLFVLKIKSSLFPFSEDDQASPQATSSVTNQHRTPPLTEKHEVKTEAHVRLEGSSHHPHKTQNKAPKRRWSSESIENQKVVTSTKVPKVHRRISTFEAEGVYT